MMSLNFEKYEYFWGGLDTYIMHYAFTNMDIILNYY